MQRQLLRESRVQRAKSPSELLPDNGREFARATKRLRNSGRRQPTGIDRDAQRITFSQEMRTSSRGELWPFSDHFDPNAPRLVTFKRNTGVIQQLNGCRGAAVQLQCLIATEIQA
jgi:hypothetical protein